LKRIMNAEPVLVFRTVWSRKVLIACANGASADPDVEDETGQLVGIVGIEVVVLVVGVVEFELATLFVVVELVVDVIVWTDA